MTTPGSPAPPEAPGPLPSARHAWLSRLAPPLLHRVVTSPNGELRPRGEAILAMREALLAGRTPQAHEISWPEEDFRGPLCEALEAARVASCSRGDVVFTEGLLLFVLAAVEDAQIVFDRALVAFRALVRGGRIAPSIEGQTDEERARRGAQQVIGELLRSRGRGWAELVETLQQFGQLFAEIVDHLGLPPELVHRMVGSLPSAYPLRMNELARAIPVLQGMVPMLRWQEPSDDPFPVPLLARLGRELHRAAEPLFTDSLADRESTAAGQAPAAASRVTGQAPASASPAAWPGGASDEGAASDKAGGGAAWLLAGEAMPPTHPTLRLLWRAQRFERSLLEAHGRTASAGPPAPRDPAGEGRPRDPAQGSPSAPASFPRPGLPDALGAIRKAWRGPVVVIVDGYHPMLSRRALGIKAVVLHVVGVAVREQRRCYVRDFRGARDEVGHELSFEGEGLLRLLFFLSAPTNQGVDVDDALFRTCASVVEKGWTQADIVLISHGSFDLLADTLAALHEARANRELCLHAVPILEDQGFLHLACDSIHRWLRWVDRQGR